MGGFGSNGGVLQLTWLSETHSVGSHSVEPNKTTAVGSVTPKLNPTMMMRWPPAIGRLDGVTNVTAGLSYSKMLCAVPVLQLY